MYCCVNQSNRWGGVMDETISKVGGRSSVAETSGRHDKLERKAPPPVAGLAPVRPPIILRSHRRRKDAAFCNRTYICHHDCLKSLACAVIQRAVEDYRQLEHEGLIVNGEAVPEWDRAKYGRHRLNFYYSIASIKQLVSWFRLGYFRSWLTAIDSGIDGDAAVAALGIREKSCEKPLTDSGKM